MAWISGRAFNSDADHMEEMCVLACTGVSSFYAVCCWVSHELYI